MTNNHWLLTDRSVFWTQPYSLSAISIGRLSDTRRTSTRKFSVRRFLRVQVWHRSSGSSLSPRESACTHIHTRAGVRAHNGHRSKFYPHLAIIQPCRFILLESCASVQASSSTSLALLPLACTTVLLRQLHTRTFNVPISISQSEQKQAKDRFHPVHSIAHRPIRLPAETYRSDLVTRTYIGCLWLTIFFLSLPSSAQLTYR